MICYRDWLAHQSLVVVFPTGMCSSVSALECRNLPFLANFTCGFYCMNKCFHRRRNLLWFSLHILSTLDTSTFAYLYFPILTVFSSLTPFMSLFFSYLCIFPLCLSLHLPPLVLSLSVFPIPLTFSDRVTNQTVLMF